MVQEDITLLLKNARYAMLSGPFGPDSGGPSGVYVQRGGVQWARDMSYKYG